VQEGSLPIAASSKLQPGADPRLTALFEDANLLHLLFKFEKMNVYRIDDLNYLEKQDIYELGVGTVDKRKIDQLMTRLKISAWVTASAPARRTNSASPSAGSPSTTCAALPATRVSLIDPTNSSCSATMRFRVYINFVVCMRAALSLSLWLGLCCCRSLSCSYSCDSSKIRKQV